MTIQVFGPEATVSYLNRAFSDTSPSYAVYQNQVDFATKQGDTAFAKAFAATKWAGVSNADLSKLVLTNMGVLPSTDTSVTALEGALTEYFTANFAQTKDAVTGQVATDLRGVVVLQLANLLAGLETKTGAVAVYNKAAVAWNQEVASAYTYSTNASNTTTSVAGAPTVVAGKTLVLTTASDTLVGSAGNDTFDGITTADTLSSYDSLDGGDGVDALNVYLGSLTSTVTTIPAGVSIKNVENINVNAVASAVFTVNESSYTGVTTLNLNSAGTSAGASVSGATGVVNVTANGGAVTVTGDKLTAASVKGSATASTIENTATAGGTTFVSTLTAVTLENVGAAFAIKGKAFDTLTWKNQTTAATATITNDTSTALTVNVDGAGVSGTTPAAATVTAGAKAAAVTVNATGVASNVAVSGTVLKTVNVTGSGNLELNPSAIVTAIDGSAATGKITLQSALNEASVLAIKTGAGNDSITLESIVKDASSINLGAGDDKLMVKVTVAGTAGTLSGANYASAGTATSFVGSFGGTSSTIDGGAGTDTVAIQLLGTPTQFKNFEVIDIGSLTADTWVDAGQLTATSGTATSITGLVLSTAAVTTYTASGSGTSAAPSVTTLPGNATISNLATGGTLTVTNQGGAPGSTNLSLANAAGTADAFNVTFAGASTTAGTTSDAGVVTLDGVENFTIVSGGTSSLNKLTLADNALQSLTITGAKDFTLTAGTIVGKAPTNATTDSVNGVKLVDGSAATGKLNINLSTVNAANAGVTLKGGTASDTLVGSAANDTIIGGGGKDMITGGLGGDKITVSGGGNTIKIGATAAVVSPAAAATNDTGVNNANALQTSLLTSPLDVISGLTIGDKLVLGATPTAAGPYSASFVAGTSLTIKTTLEGTDNQVVFARGTYDATAQRFTYDPAGADTALTYDCDSTANTVGTTPPDHQDFHTVILVGFVPSTTASTVAGAAYSTTGTAATITLG